jgi:hypothetical protein
MPRSNHAVHGVDRCRRAGRELIELSVLHEEQEAEQRRVLIVCVTEAANHRRQLSARGRLVVRKGLEPACELDVMAFEDRPHELVFADEMAIERTF